MPVPKPSGPGGWAGGVPEGSMSEHRVSDLEQKRKGALDAYDMEETEVEGRGGIARRWHCWAANNGTFHAAIVESFRRQEERQKAPGT